MSTADPADDLVSFRAELGRLLAGLREAAGYTIKDAAKCSGIRPVLLQQIEDATCRTSMPRLVRLTSLYGADLLQVLESAGASVRPPGGSLFQPLVDALFYYCGVTPEQVAQRAHNLATFYFEPAESTSSLGEAVKHRRDDNPTRVQGGLIMRREYEAGASIRQLSVRHQLAFGTVRTLLLEADTVLRAPGKPTDAGTAENASQSSAP